MLFHSVGALQGSLARSACEPTADRAVGVVMAAPRVLADGRVD